VGTYAGKVLHLETTPGTGEAKNPTKQLQHKDSLAKT